MLNFPLPAGTLPTLLASVLLIAALWIAKSFATRGRARLPPGPPRLPILGNALQMVSTYTWLYYTELSKTYGDVFYLSALGQPLLVLSSIEANTDLLVKQASVFSGRPYIAMVIDLIGWKSSFIFTDPVPAWKAQRKLVHQFLGAPAMPLYHPMLESGAYDLVQRLVTDKNDFSTEVTYTMAQFIMRIGYGIKINSPNDELCRLSSEASHNLEYSVELGNFLVNLFPVLRHIPPWFPFANFRKTGALWRQNLLDAVDVPFNRVLEDIAKGTAEPSFCARSIEDRPVGITDDHIKWAGGSLYVASANSTMSTMGTFLMAMIKNPAVQVKAQAEIDRVIGTERLPTLADRDQLPYVNCIFKEILRWHPAAPSGLPHLTSEAAEYRGWYIPKNTIIVANTWAMSRDPKVYRSADDFIPERYEENPDLIDYRTYAFGFGRRICAGQAFAEQSLWIMMATLLSAVHMRPALDENGAEIEIEEKYTGKNVTAPVPFPHRLEPRSSHLMTLLHASSEAH